MRLNKNSMPAKLVERIVENGEEKTYSEWAKEFRVSVPVLQQAIGTLRKKGFMINPVGTVLDPFHGAKEGILKDVLNSVHDTREIMHRNNKRSIIPNLKAQFRLLEEMVSKWPNLMVEARSEANQYMKFLITKEEELKHANSKPQTIGHQTGSEPAPKKLQPRQD